MKKGGYIWILIFIFLVSGCHHSTEDSSLLQSEESSQSSLVVGSSETLPTILVQPIEIPSEVDRYQDATLFGENHEIPLMNVKVNDSHVYAYPNSTRIDSGYGRVYLEGSAQFTLVTNYEITTATKIYPSNYKIIPTHNLSQKQIFFEIYAPGIYVIVPNDDELKAIHLRVFDFAEIENEEYISGFGDDFTTRITFDSGVHDATNSEYINSSNEIRVTSNTLIYIKEGAVVDAKIVGKNVNNVVICGHGIIRGATFSRIVTVVPVDFSFSNDLIFSDFSLIDPAAWTLNLYFVNDSVIDEVSIISSRANGDGVTLQSCNNIEVTNVFVRSFDDALVVKNYANPYGNTDRETHGSSSKITFDNCFLWIDLAQAMEIGYETAGPVIEDITFQNITVFYALHKPVISIHNSNYADLYNIRFENITVENLNTGQGDAGGNNELIDIKSTYSSVFSNKAVGPTEVGNIYGLTIKNVLVKRKADFNRAKITIMGQKDTRPDFVNIISVVSNITLENITIIKTNIDANYGELYTNEYVQNLNVIKGTATGHILL